MSNLSQPITGTVVETDLYFDEGLDDFVYMAMIDSDDNGLVDTIHFGTIDAFASMFMGVPIAYGDMTQFRIDETSGDVIDYQIFENY